MNELAAQMKVLTRIYVLFLVICGVCWLFITSARTPFAGLALGGSVSFLNAIHLQRGTIRVMDSLTTQQRKSGFGFGFFVRASFSVAAALIAIKLPQIDLLFTIVGIAFAPLAIIIAGMVQGILNKPD